MEIVRKITVGKGKNHYLSSCIKGLQEDVNNKGTFIMRFVDTTSGGAWEKCVEVSDALYRRIKKGDGSYYKPLSYGLVSRPRWNFIIVTEEDPKRKNEVCVAVHAFPHINYADADFNTELEKTLPENSVVAIVHEDGQIDIVAIVREAYREIPSLIKEIEKKDKIKNGDIFNINGSTYSISQIAGQEVIFRWRSKYHSNDESSREY